MDRKTLLEIELSAANLYSRLALRARREGLEKLAITLAGMAKEERAQAQSLDPGIRTGVTKPGDRWSHYRPSEYPQGSKKKWVWGASLGSRDARVARYLGPEPESQPWSEVLPKLGSAELLIAFYYLVFLRDPKTFTEELKHSRHNGVKLKYLLKGLLCLIGG